MFCLFSQSARSLATYDLKPLSDKSRGRWTTVHLIEPGRRQRQIECGGDILRFHSRAELPGDNEAREVVEHGGEDSTSPSP